MKKKFLSLEIIIILAVMLFVLTGCVNNKNNNVISNEQEVDNQELESNFSDINWAQLYYEDEITHSKNDIDSKWKSNNIKTYFIQTEITPYPVMIQIADEYGDTTLGKKGVVFISYIDGESHSVNNISYIVGHSIELLYNRELNEYRWYVHTKYDNSDEYLDIAKEIVENMKIISNEETIKTEVYKKYQNEDKKYNQYSFRKDKEDLDKNFDSIFIKLENFNLDDADIMKDYTDEKEIKNNIQKAAKKFKPQSQLLTAEIKSLVEDKKISENSRENTEVVFNEEGIQIGKYFAQYGTYNWELNTEYKIELNKDKIKEIFDDGKVSEFDYKIEDYDFSQDPDSSSSVHKAIVMYKDGTAWGGFYIDKNNHLTNEGTGQYELATTTQVNSAENNLSEEYIVLKDYKLRNGLYVTLPTIETLAISSTSGKYRISNETGTFSINENQINLENGMTLTVIADNQFSCNGKTYTLSKEY